MGMHTICYDLTWLLESSMFKGKVLWKESLHSNAQQFHQFQESEQLPLINIIAQEKTAIDDNKNLCSGLRQAQKCGRVISRVIVPSPPSSMF